jgi:DNA recombination protein RmuC
MSSYMEIATLILVLGIILISQIFLMEQRLRREASDQAREGGQWREELRTVIDGKLELMRGILDQRIRDLQVSNETKLEQMRSTVDEKLQSTLERRLGESFRQVSEHLASVQRGLGEMQNLAQGVGSLNRVLGNVKSRGIFGETQLELILSDMLAPQQYCREFSPQGNGERVEFAVRLPSQAEPGASETFIPIDAKFPREDYERMVAASEISDREALESARRALLRRLEDSAAEISSKYIVPPVTTNFALMFLATEGLYAEVLREPGFQERLQREYRVIVTGPATLSAILTSLAVGFQTLAIEQRSGEIRRVLGEVRNEFGRFALVLAKVQKQLGTASRSIDDTFRRTQKMERALRGVDGAAQPLATEVFEVDELDDGDQPTV